MLEDTVKKMEDAVRKIDALKGQEKTELLSLLCALKTEVGRLAETHEEQAHRSEASPTWRPMRPRARTNPRP